MRIPLYFKLLFLITLGIFSPLIVSLFFIHDILIHNLFISIGLGILTVLFTSAITYLILKPLKSLTKSAQALGSGNFSQRANIRSGDEFETVGKSFDQMADNLKRIFETEEQQKNAALIEKSKLDEVLSSIVDGIVALNFNKNVTFMNKAAEEITGYTMSQLNGKRIDLLLHFFVEGEEVPPKIYSNTSFNQTVNLVAGNGTQTKINLSTHKIADVNQKGLDCILTLHDLSKEEELEQMKLDFVSMASHELKTPLTSIIGYLSVFIGENKGKISKDELNLLEKSLISAQQLYTLIQNILNVNKIERDQLAVSSQTVDYQAILTKAAEDLKNQSQQKNIILTLSLPKEGLPKVIADPVRISEVVTNLVANAINYTSPGGKVDIAARLSPQEITTVISDTGIGIPKDALPNLFNKFFRVSNTKQQSSKGTGLGLYIAKEIITKLNGKIWVESEVGKGSKFYFTLPVVSEIKTFSNEGFVGQAISQGALNY